MTKKKYVIEESIFVEPEQNSGFLKPCMKKQMAGQMTIRGGVAHQPKIYV